LVRPADVSPSSDNFELIGTFNPASAQTADGVVLLVRVAERPRQGRPGLTGLPRWQPGQGILIDWVPNDAHELIDSRILRRKTDGLTRLPFISYLKTMRSNSGEQIDDFDGPVFAPDSALEEYGVEDARITPLEGRYYFTYVAVSRHGVATALASTDDFRKFDRHGVIFGPENKDVVLFPERIGGQYVALHRPSGSAGFSRPEIWIAKSPDLRFWGDHQHLRIVGERWNSARIGAGPPPIRVEEGWLVFYHGCSRPQRPTEIGVYSASVLLLDHDDPSRILRHSASPLLTPELDFEREGFVPDVVFPTGIVEKDRELLIYYGAADTCTAVVKMSLDEVLDSMTPHVNKA
jgi:predicted GH43/DUF377 family glycosyl hydrolase